MKSNPSVESAHDGPRSEMALLAAIVFMAISLRVLWLNADPPTSLEWSIAPFTDEALYSHAARNRVLFGAPVLSDWDNRMVSPLFDGLAWGSFSLLGVGYPQLRLISVLSSTAALPMLWDLLRKDLGTFPALMGTAALAFDYVWMQYGRLGLLEPGLTACLILVAWTWRRSLDGNRWFAYACGVAVGLAFVWKSLALVVLPVPVLATIICRTPARASVLAFGGLGLLTSGAAYFGLWYWPHHAQIDAYTAFYASDRFPTSAGNAWQALRSTFSTRHLLAKTPVLAAAGFIGLALVLRSARLGRPVPPAVAYAALWLSSEVALSLMPYSPPRYHLIVLPAVAVLASYAGFFARANGRAIIASLALVTALALGLARQAAWAMDRRYTVAEASRTIEAAVPRGAKILGAPACSLGMATALECIPTIAGMTKPAPIARYAPAYAIADEDNRKDYLKTLELSQLLRAERVSELKMGPRRCSLYRLAH
jgi:4-amino-4-deoxy-L-arabinose transferase-like glycosyltransferase